MRSLYKKKKLPIVAEELYKHYKKRNWLTKKGTQAKSVEVLCNAWNSIPAHRVGVIQGNAKVKTKNIDWGQRRYEIAKSVYSTTLRWLLEQGGKISQQWIEDNRAARNAVYFADALIEELKKNN